tara:strand:- start:945 stop:1619 length:675 start_codon:yes stop_codon:yes gene_type:complete
MADRIPLIVNSDANQIQELPTSDSLQLNDSNSIKLGNSGELSIQHTSSGISKILHNVSTGSGDDLRLQIAGNQMVFEKSNGDNFIVMTHSTGEVKLCHAATGNEKLKTLSTGIDITGALRVTGDITAFYSSDIKLKTEITPIPNALDKVSSISGNTFKWNEKTHHEGEDTGIIAQEIEKLNLPGLTQTRDNGIKAVRYDKLVPLLIEAIKELKSEVDELKTLER